MQQTNLFGPAAQAPPISADLLQYIPAFFNENESAQLFHALQATIAWKQEELMLYGKKIKTPRLTAWYGDQNVAYKYSGVTFYALPFTAELIKIKAAIEPLANQQFNSVLLNLYRDGNDSMGWHADDEPELGKNPIIASVNFGQPRRFDFRHKDNHAIKHQIMLGNGSLLIMKGDIQHHWQHQIAKSLKVKEVRINLTFRKVG